MTLRVPMLLATLAASHTVSAESFDLQALIAAARQEAPITIYAPSGKIVDTAAAFSQKYGLKAEGIKINGVTYAVGHSLTVYAGKAKVYCKVRDIQPAA